MMVILRYLYLNINKMALCYNFIEMRIRLIKDIVNKKKRVKDVAEYM